MKAIRLLVEVASSYRRSKLSVMRVSIKSLRLALLSLINIAL
jgi:hypothetical protein